MEYNFGDDRTHELEINPCKGCEDYQNGKCISYGGCFSSDLEFDCSNCSQLIRGECVRFGICFD